MMSAIRRPNAIEYYDGADNNCDAFTDEEGSIGGLSIDADIDGHGDIDEPTLACSQPTGYVETLMTVMMMLRVIQTLMSYAIGLILTRWLP